MHLIVVHGSGCRGTKFTAKTEQIKGESYLGLKVRHLCVLNKCWKTMGKAQKPCQTWQNPWICWVENCDRKPWFVDSDVKSMGLRRFLLKSTHWWRNLLIFAAFFLAWGRLWDLDMITSQGPPIRATESCHGRRCTASMVVVAIAGQSLPSRPSLDCVDWNGGLATRNWLAFQAPRSVANAFFKRFHVISAAVGAESELTSDGNFCHTYIYS